MSFCPHAWNTVSILPGKVAPCCWFMFHWELSENITDPLNSEEFASIRNKMLAGEIIPQCQQCNKNEKLGIQSNRQIAIKTYGTEIPEVKLKEIDISFDNICNLKCRGCDSGNSHLWKKDEELIYGKSVANKKYLENNISFDVSKLEKIQISGGEPLISPKFIPFFNSIRDTLKNKSIAIVTNGTILLKDSIIQDLKKCKNFNLAISIDGTRETHNYFRSGNFYDTIMQNFEVYYKEFKDCDNVEMQIITTVNVYNVHEINEIKNNLKKYTKIVWTVKPLEYPKKLNIKNLPTAYKNKIKNLIDIKHITSLLEENSDTPFSEFLEYHNKLDAIRGERIPHSIFSEFLNELQR